MQRRLPVYILIDTSGSMKGEAIQSVNSGLRAMISTLRQDPYALESAWLSLITFDNEVKEVFALTPLERVQLQEITTPSYGATLLGAALQLLLERVDRDIRRSSPENKADWKPLLFVMTDGSPSDPLAYRQAIPEIHRRGFGSILACGVGPKAKLDELRELTDQVVLLETMDSAGFASLFRWVSTSVSSGSNRIGGSTALTLPPPPPEIRVVL